MIKEVISFLKKTAPRLYRYLFLIVLFLYKKIPALNKRFPTLPAGKIRSLKTWLEKQDKLKTHYKIIRESYREISSINFDTGDNREFLPYSEIAYPEIYFASLGKVIVSRDTGYVIEQKTKKVILESVPNMLSDRFIKVSPFYEAIQKFPVYTIDQPATFIFPSNNYFHWHSEVIPRLLQLKKHLPEIIIYSNELVSEWQKQSLGFYNIKNFQILPDSSHPFLLFEQFHFISFNGMNAGVPDKKVIFDMNQVVRQKINEKSFTVQSYERIYVSRKKAAHRRVVNEDELENLLCRTYNFVTVNAEDYSVPQQYELFANAKFVVAVHGPSLSNALACSGATIIELANENHILPCYFQIAASSGNRYILIKNKSIGTPNTVLKKSFYGYNDIEVDIQRTNQLLKSLNL